MHTLVIEHLGISVLGHSSTMVWMLYFLLF